MARGKYLSLEEARKMKGGLDRFAKEHPFTGDWDKFNRLFRAMVSGKQPPDFKSVKGKKRKHDK